jgi:hypothetical protein
MWEKHPKVLWSTIPLTLVCALIIWVVPTVSISVWAQPQAPQETFFESSLRTANETGTMASETGATTPPAAAAPTTTANEAAASQGVPGGDRPLLWQGQISSKSSDVPGREGAQSAIVISPREDNSLLSGTLTYQASRPVTLIVWNNVDLGNTSAIPEQFGDLGDIVKIGGKSVALTEIGSGTSGSIPFTGNAIELVGEEDPFIVTYSLDAKPAQAKIVSDIQSLKSFNATALEAQQGEGDEDEGG